MRIFALCGGSDSGKLSTPKLLMAKPVKDKEHSVFAAFTGIRFCKLLIPMFLLDHAS